MTFDLTPWHSTPWLMEQGHLQRLAAKLAVFPHCYSARDVAKARKRALAEARELPGRGLASGGVLDAGEKQLAAPGKAIRAVQGRVGVIGVYGPLQQRTTSELMKVGGTSMEFIGEALDQLLNDAATDAIVLDVDSPGGSSYGTEELADKIFAARGQKQLIAVANSLMASAAVWIGTAADLTVVSPGADIGSIGVYALHVDESLMMEAAGVKVTPVVAGKYKIETAPFAPLSTEAKNYLQQQVDITYDKFLAAMKRNRNVSIEHVRTKFGEGRVLDAQKAVEVGLADRVLSLDEVLRKLTGGRAAAATRAADASGPTVEVLRLRHERAKQKLERGLLVGTLARAEGDPEDDDEDDGED